MGGCCSKGGSSREDDVDEKVDDVDEEDDIRFGDEGARIRLRGPSSFTSMYTQQGKKGINQDAMTVWEDFAGEKETFFCGVFDGHGPSGHKVARHIRDTLPSTLSTALKMSQTSHRKYSDIDLDLGEEDDPSESYNSFGDKSDRLSNSNRRNQSLPSWETSFVESFMETDEKLSKDTSIDAFCSGSTAVAVVKQGSLLMVANLGDSRAVLCTKGDNNQLLPVQLTVDLKPNIPSEAERIRSCRGRIFTVYGEPQVYRLWMPDQDCPGLAMSRAFGDFCLKEHGLISSPVLSYRKITDNDQFVVLATDGVWDVLSNSEVIKIVASAKKRSMAAKLLVNRAVRAWRFRYPCSNTDDCAAICLFLKNQLTTSTKPVSETTPGNVNFSAFNSSSFFPSQQQGFIHRRHRSCRVQGESKENSRLKTSRSSSF